MAEAPAKTVGVVGAGTMGGGIAQLAAVAGHPVALYDVRLDLAEAGRERIAALLRRAADGGKTTPEAAAAALARIRPTASLAELAGAELVVEAAPESLEAKRRIFAELAGRVSPRAILASNTSSLSIAAIAEGLPAPERVAGMHFFNPAPVLPLVEVVRGRLTSEETVAAVAATARAWGKTPIVVADTPGFVVNRVARPFHLETFRMLEEGVAPIETIDAAVERAGFRMGPGKLLDLIGLDVNLEVTRSVWEGSGRHPRFEPSPLQSRMVEAGHLGRKSGRGFYAYEGGRTPVRDEPGSDLSGDDPARLEAIGLRVVACVANEAALALGDGIAAAADIETAMRLGTSYPRGPLAWARALGLDRVLGVLRALAAKRPERYPIAPRLVSGELG